MNIIEDNSVTVLPEPPVDGASVMEWLRAPQAGDLALLLKDIRLDRDGFRAADVEKVEAFWRLIDMDYAEGGYLIRLRDGRRLHLTWFSDDLSPEERPDGAPEGHQEGTHAALLADGQRYPEGLPESMWSTDVEDINEAVKQFQLPY